MESPLWPYLEEIRSMRRARKSWAAIALELRQAHGIETTRENLYRFFRRAGDATAPAAGEATAPHCDSPRGHDSGPFVKRAYIQSWSAFFEALEANLPKERISGQWHSITLAFGFTLGSIQRKS